MNTEQLSRAEKVITGLPDLHRVSSEAGSWSLEILNHVEAQVNRLTDDSMREAIFSLLTKAKGKRLKSSLKNNTVGSSHGSKALALNENETQWALVRRTKINSRLKSAQIEQLEKAVRGKPDLAKLHNQIYGWSQEMLEVALLVSTYLTDEERRPSVHSLLSAHDNWRKADAKNNADVDRSISICGGWVLQSIREADQVILRQRMANWTASQLNYAERKIRSCTPSESQRMVQSCINDSRSEWRIKAAPNEHGSVRASAQIPGRQSDTDKAMEMNDSDVVPLQLALAGNPDQARLRSQLAAWTPEMIVQARALAVKNTNPSALPGVLQELDSAAAKFKINTTTQSSAPIDIKNHEARDMTGVSIQPSAGPSSQEMASNNSSSHHQFESAANYINQKANRLLVLLEKQNSKQLNGYAANPDLIQEHHNIEKTVLSGGYDYRQILELVQNGADAITEAHEVNQDLAVQNRIEVILRKDRLYVANTGASISDAGLKALLNSHSSSKRGNQIGRFGLGFKSLLKLHGAIDIFTHDSGDIRFDPDRCAAEIREKFGVLDAPRMRIAYALDPLERIKDAELHRLSWAETIVRIEIPDADKHALIRGEIEKFPAEFLLFFRIPTTLHLDFGVKSPRTISVVKEEEHLILNDGKTSSRWLITECNVSIAEKRAVDDAGDIHTRGVTPITWAFPLEGKRESAGNFWAFFPTDTPSFVPGIINAPWKLNSDRTAIIKGEWNTALMKEAAQLVAATIPKLASDMDPGKPLDAFPRHSDPGVIAQPLIERLWHRLIDAPVVANGLGEMVSARVLNRPPNDLPKLNETWLKLATDESKRQLPHFRCLDHHRANRLEGLATRLVSEKDFPSRRLRRLSVGEWFLAIAPLDLPQVAATLRLAYDFAKECKSSEWESVRDTLKIISDASGQLRTSSEVLLLPSGTDRDFPAQLHPVHPTLADDYTLRYILKETLHVREPDDHFWEQLLSNTVEKHPVEFWNHLSAAPEHLVDSFIKHNNRRILVHRMDGSWGTARNTLRIGTLITNADLNKNAKLTISGDFLKKHEPTIKKLGMRDMPSLCPVYTELKDDYNSPFWRWLTHVRNRYVSETGLSPNKSYLLPSFLMMPDGWELLINLSESPAKRLTDELLRIANNDAYKVISLGHETQHNRYPSKQFDHPLKWFIREYGKICINERCLPISWITENATNALLSKFPSGISEVKSAFPKSRASDLGAIEQYCAAVTESFISPESVAADSLGFLWEDVGRFDFVPKELPSKTGATPITAVWVTDSPERSLLARRHGRITVTLTQKTKTLWVKHGAQDLDRALAPAWIEIIVSGAKLLSVLPELDEVLTKEASENARCTLVEGLSLNLAARTLEQACLMHEGVLLLDRSAFHALPTDRKFSLLINELSGPGWLALSREDAERKLVNAQGRQLMAVIAAQSSLADRLLHAVGKKEESLRQSLGEHGAKWAQNLNGGNLARLTLSYHGPVVLSVPVLREAMRSVGLNPPERLGSEAGRRFVNALGFPPEYAAASETKREPEVTVMGPFRLPPLHDYQEEVVDEVGRLITSGTRRRRAVISLPTGGGKTRCAVECAVRHVLAQSNYPTRQVLWVAQSDELCEQAVQAFRQVWHHLGSERTELRIIRLWGGASKNPAQPPSDSPVVTVATIQTLQYAMERPDVAWLKEPGLLIVDECHHAITKSYTGLLEWLNAGGMKSAKNTTPEPPILALSATPFRADEGESAWLANRFDNRWFPSNQASLHSRLQANGVLARAEYESLDSQFKVSESDVDRLLRLDENREGIERDRLLEAINQELALHEPRNQQLLKRLAQASERSILFFANSVSHAKTMALRLNSAGIPSAAIDGETPTSARRYFISKFQSGEIRVLCNRDVLTTGFDAPKTDMILIARQVFSPVRYMQMIGRGLRGEKNGGKAHCRIVTVMDNLGRFQNRHPYHYCMKHYQ